MKSKYPILQNLGKERKREKIQIQGKQKYRKERYRSSVTKQKGRILKLKNQRNLDKQNNKSSHLIKIYRAATE